MHAQLSDGAVYSLDGDISALLSDPTSHYFLADRCSSSDASRL